MIKNEWDKYYNAIIKPANLNEQMVLVIRDAFFTGGGLLLERITDNPNNQAEIALALRTGVADMREYKQETLDRHTDYVFNSLPKGATVQ